MPVQSAGLLLHRSVAAGAEVLIAHMGGPFWARKDAGAWSIPKGEYDPAAETPLAAALREFEEELGVAPPAGPYDELGAVSYSGKRLTIFVADGTGFAAPSGGFGEFELEWPPRSGRVQSFPEVDRAEWMPLPAAREKLVKGQQPVLDLLDARPAP